MVLTICVVKLVVGSGRTGYGTLIGFEMIVQKIMKDYSLKKTKIDYNVWKGGYIHH